MRLAESFRVAFGALRSNRLRSALTMVGVVIGVAAVIILVALPIKTYAFLTMNKQGWLTRRADLIGGEGQNAASLSSSSRRGVPPGKSDIDQPPPVIHGRSGCAVA